MESHESFGISKEAAEEYDRASEIINEFSEFTTLMQMIQWVLETQAAMESDGKFSNTTAALAAFTRAFHDIQGAISLCQVHSYPQALALTRSVYEAAGIGRTMAHSFKIADKWLLGQWQPDAKARQFVRNVMYRDEDPTDVEDAVSSYADSYELLSRWAHVTATSALSPYIEDTENGYALVLYPQFDEQMLRFTLNTILHQTIFLAYAIRNATARLEALGAEWLQTLDAISKQVLGSYAQELEIDYEALDQRRQNIVTNLRNSSEHKRAMKHESNAIDNLLREPDQE